MYLSNITQLKPNSDKTPYELWKAIPTSLKHFRVFGRKFFIKRNDKNIENFDSHANEGILLGYFAQRKGYKCYNKQTKGLEDCIDEVIDETPS